MAAPPLVVVAEGFIPEGSDEVMANKGTEKTGGPAWVVSVNTLPTRLRPAPALKPATPSWGIFSAVAHQPVLTGCWQPAWVWARWIW